MNTYMKRIRSRSLGTWRINLEKESRAKLAICHFFLEFHEGVSATVFDDRICLGFLAGVTRECGGDLFDIIDGAGR